MKTMVGLKRLVLNKILYAAKVVDSVIRYKQVLPIVNAKKRIAFASLIAVANHIL